jgi:hypothetical protein
VLRGDPFNETSDLYRCRCIPTAAVMVLVTADDDVMVAAAAVTAFTVLES